MEYVDSFNAIKAGKAYIIEIDNMTLDNRVITFHVDSGASVTLLGINSFCKPGDESQYALLYSIVEKEIQSGQYESNKNLGKTITYEELEMYPCKISGVSILGTKPFTLYFHIYPGKIGMPLLGFDYIDDTSYHHTIAGDLVFNAIAEQPGSRFYSGNVIDFNKILDTFNKQKHSIQ